MFNFFGANFCIMATKIFIKKSQFVFSAIFVIDENLKIFTKLSRSLRKKLWLCYVFGKANSKK